MGNKGNRGTEGNQGNKSQFLHFLYFPQFPVFLSFLVLYLLTLSPGLLPADSGEYQVTGALLGVAHPPGFALYTLLSWLTTKLLFFLAPATTLNVLSALLATLTLTLVCRTVQHLTGSGWAGLGAALFLGLSTTFWAQAVTANIRMPTACATAWLVERVAERLGNRGNEGTQGNTNQFPHFLYFPQFPLFFSLGLGVAHHASLAFVAGVFGLYILYRQITPPIRHSLLSSLFPFLFTALPFLSWHYFPLRAGSVGAPPGIATWNGFWEHVLARGFAGDMFHFANPQDLPDRLRILGNLLTFQWTWPGLIFLALGGGVALWRYRPLGFVLVGALLLHTFVALTYRAPQTVEYLIPAYVLAAVLVGIGVAWLVSRVVSWSSSRFVKNRLVILSSCHLVTLAFLALTQALTTFPSYLTLAQDTSTRDYAETLLDSAPQNSLILANWHWATPLWYLQKVEGHRPDVEIRYVFPRTASLAQDWVSDIATALPARPVVVTSFYPQEFTASPYRFLPLGPAWQVLAEPLLTAPAAREGAEKFGDWEFLGYQVQNPKPLGEGQYVITNHHLPMTLFLAWRTARQHDINFFAQLLNAEGALVSQFDVAYPAARYAANEVLLDRYTLHLPPTLPVGDYALVVGAYLPDGTRVAEKNIGNWRLAIETPIANHQSPSLFFGSEMALTASAFPATARAGETVAVSLDFLALRPLVNDYTVSISVIGPNWQWKAQSDSTPASGAIPTLKWITGSRVTDRHTLTLPPDAAPGLAQVYVTVYDAFTLAPLPVFDPTPLGTTLNLGAIEIVAP